MQAIQTKFTTSGHRAVNADGIKSAAKFFAEIKARKEFGLKGTVGAFQVTSESADGRLVEISAFIGKRYGNSTTGNNVNFTVFRA